MADLVGALAIAVGAGCADGRAGAAVIRNCTVGGHLLPDKLASYVSGKAADKLLEVIANAMLAVTTFSLTVMVSVYQSSSSQFTPRVHRLIVQDPTTKNTPAAFIGAYVYALTGNILREMAIFTDDRAFLLFVMTVLVLIYVVVSMVRWVLHLQPCSYTTMGAAPDANGFDRGCVWIIGARWCRGGGGAAAAAKSTDLTDAPFLPRNGGGG